MAGNWEGILGVSPAVKLRLRWSLVATDGKLSGYLVSLDQGNAEMPLSLATSDGKKVHLEAASIGATFDGHLEAGKLTGTFTQRGLSLPLELTHTGAVTARLRPQLPKAPFPYDDHEVTVAGANGVTLAGSLTEPRGKGPFPAVVLITGSGQQDRDESLFGHKPFLVLADALTRRGIAVLRVDDRGMGGSKGEVQTATTVDFADDVRASLKFLRARAEIRKDAVGLIGHSEGGLIASLVAAGNPDVAFVVLLASTGLTGAKVIESQIAHLMKAAGAPAAEITAHVDQQRVIDTIVVGEKDDAKLQIKLKEALKNATPSEQARILHEAMVPWFRSFLALDPAVSLRKITCPVLALDGSLDLQVISAENLPAIRAALEAGGNKAVTATELPGLNHLFQTAKTGLPNEYVQIEETMAPSVLKTVGDFILARTTAK